MATVTETAPRLMTAEEFLALPDDGMERMLIRGKLWEKPMVWRDRWHSSTEARIAALLGTWLEDPQKPRGGVYSGGACFHIGRHPDTIVGIDVACTSAEVESGQTDDGEVIDGPPLLAVEILSPSDKHEEIAAKVDSYREAGVPLVWVVDPHFRTVTVHRPDSHPEMFTGDDELSGDPHLPGFHLTVSWIFER